MSEKISMIVMIDFLSVRKVARCIWLYSEVLETVIDLRPEDVCLIC